jgi:hypothetical protein
VDRALQRPLALNSGSPMQPLHPLLRLCVEQPELAAEHASAYAALLVEDGTAAALQLQRRVALQWVGGVCAAVATTLAGTALMLWAALPSLPMPHPELLWAVPAVPLLLLGWVIGVRRSADAPPFAALRQQVQADLAWLRNSRVPAKVT